MFACGAALPSVDFFLASNSNHHSRYLTILTLVGLSALAVDAIFSFLTERLEHGMYIFIMAAMLIANYIKTSHMLTINRHDITPPQHSRL